MKLAIIGSRNVQKDIIEKIKKSIDFNCDEIVSGGAHGIDELAEKIAYSLKIKVKIFKPNYKKYGKIAPLIRNKQIIDYSDKVLAFWNYKSKGTRHAILYALKIDKKINIFIID